MAETTGPKLVFGTQENDVLVASAQGGEHLFALAGDDVLAAASRSNVLHGGDGSDTLGVTGASNTLYGEGGDDRLLVTSGENAVHGNSGNDRLEVAGSSNLITGGAGADSLLLQGSDNEASMGAGDDTVELLTDAGLDLSRNTVHLGTGTDSMVLSGISDGTVRGGEGGDDIYALLVQNNRYDGEAGDDTFNTYNAVHSTIAGGAGNDLFNSTPGDFEYNGNEYSKYYGNDGSDEFFMTSDDCTYSGGNGQDTFLTADYSNFRRNVVRGEGGNDLLQTGENGGGEDNVFDGGNGQDHLSSWLAGTELLGGSGSDVLTTHGYSSKNILSGGQGQDHYVMDSVLGSSVVSDAGVKGEQDTLTFAALGRDDLTLSRDGGNLVIEAGGEELTVDRFFVNGGYRIERFELADGTVWTDTDVEKMIQAMAAAPAAGSAGDELEAGAGAQELNLLLAAGGAPDLG
ncbi:Ca2+-binding RTX toxin-like protein [Paenibacillus mucilaginosus]|uniref:calcium-binding protein n=1 Tax=Paenibacillus mucilaginosus TaxID=61624 RepID=UPI003D1DAA11